MTNNEIIFPHDVNVINGYEILDFLSKELSNQDNDILCGVSIGGPLIFKSHKVSGDKYVLIFSGFFNNWGTDQEIEDNYITITKTMVRVELSEPFDGDGSDEAIEEILIKWLPTHKFDDSVVEKFYYGLADVIEKLDDIKFEDVNKLDEIISNLVKLKSTMK